MLSQVQAAAAAAQGWQGDALRRKRSAMDSGNRPSLPSNASPRVESLSNFQTSHCPPSRKPPSEKSAPQGVSRERMRLRNEMGTPLHPLRPPPTPNNSRFPLMTALEGNAPHAPLNEQTCADSRHDPHAALMLWQNGRQCGRLHITAVDMMWTHLLCTLRGRLRRRDEPSGTASPAAEEEQEGGSRKSSECLRIGGIG